MSTAKSIFPTELRKLIPAALRRAIEDHPIAMQMAEDIDRATVAERSKLCNELVAVDPSYKKRLAAAGAAAAAAEAAVVATRQAYHDALTAQHTAQGVAFGVENQIRIERERIERELRATAPQMVRDARIAVEGLALNFYIPDLNSGVRVADNRGVPAGWGKSPKQEEATLLREWHTAHSVQQEVLGELGALELQALSAVDAAEAVTVLLRRLSAATGRIKAPVFHLGSDGSVVRTDVATKVVEVLTVRPAEKAEVLS